ncbi:MAG: hypothetical protein ABW252_08465 [Polyangiales bacterium]
MTGVNTRCLQTLGCLVALAAGCSSDAARSAPPVAGFVAPRAWKPTWGDGPPVAPPDLDAETWRVFVNQFEPIQRETPTWQALPAREAITLRMPEGSRHQCVASPLEVVAQPDDFGSKLERWLLSRTVVCSSDGFATWSSHPHRVAIDADGTRRVLARTDALLQERARDGAVRESYVALRSDKEIRAASLGAPRILEGVEVAD